MRGPVEERTYPGDPWGFDRLTDIHHVSRLFSCDTRRRPGIIIITRPPWVVWRRWYAPNQSLKQTNIPTAARS